jgi:hypothetical protein
LGLFFLIFFQTLFSSEDEVELKDDSFDDDDDEDESFNNEEREILDFCFFGFDFSLFFKN